MDPLGLFVDFIDDLNRSSGIGQSRPNTTSSKEDVLENAIGSTGRASKQANYKIQSTRSAEGSAQNPRYCSLSTSVLPSTVHTPPFLNSTPSAAQTWAKPTSHPASGLGLEHAYPSQPQYQNRQEPTPYYYANAYQIPTHHFHNDQAVPWTAYQSLGYAPDPRYIQKLSHHSSHSSQSVPISGRRPEEMGIPYDSECRDPTCQCQCFHPQSSYVNNNAAVMTRDGWVAHETAHDSKLAERR